MKKIFNTQIFVLILLLTGIWSFSSFAQSKLLNKSNSLNEIIDHNLGNNPNPQIESYGQIPYETTDVLATTITHSTNPNTVIAGTSVSCSAGGITADNQYWRSFILSNFGITNNFNVTMVEVGIENATAGSGGKQPMTVNLYTANTPWPTVSLTQIGTATVWVPDQALTLFQIPVFGTAPAGSELVVEVSIPDATGGEGHRFFMGANNLGQTAPSYLSSVGCGLPGPPAGLPVTTSAIGFPNAMWVMSVTGDQGAVIGPGPATNPTPANGGTGVSIATNLSWTNPSGVTNVQVFFGTDLTSLTSVYNGTPTTSYNPPVDLAYNTNYWWQIYETNATGVTQGYIWSFRTELPPTPTFSITPTSLEVTEKVGSTVTIPFIIENTAGGTLTISSGGITITGTNANQFSLGTITYPIELAAGETETINVSFSPTSLGTKTANLQIVHNATGSPAIVPLTGYVLPEGILFEDFTDSPIGWTVVNLDGGTESWGIYSGIYRSYPNMAGCFFEPTAIQNDDWLISPQLDVSSGDTLTFWHRQYNASYPESLYVMIGTTNDPTTGVWDTLDVIYDVSTSWQHENYNLSAYTGYKYAAFVYRSQDMFAEFVDDIIGPPLAPNPVFSLSPTSKDFGHVLVGSSSADQTFTITNIGGGTLTITSGGISIVGSDASQFVLTNANTYPIELGNGESATIDVNFTPTTSGAKTANLQIIDNLTDATHTAPLSGTAFAIPYFGDFEVFVAGQQVACQDPINWTTWSMLPCDATEDAYISSTYAYSGTKSAKIVQNNDLVKLLGKKTTGKWSVSFMAYIPTGKAGYFNTLALFSGGSSEWGMECYFNTTGVCSLFVGSATANTSTTYPPTTWFPVKVIVDLDADQAQVFINSVLAATWQWTLGASGTGCPLQLDANDFFGATANDEMYFDNYKIELASSTFPLTVNVANGWNMVATPGLHPVDQNINTWWPGKVTGTSVFKYSGGYTSVLTTQPGLGYWMKNNGAQTYNTGDEWPTGGINIVPNDPITVTSGWNMIGVYHYNVPKAGITTTGGSLTGSIFKYSSGYVSVDTLKPGYGYWAKMTAAGTIILPSSTFQVVAKQVETDTKDWGRIVITDNSGKIYTLYGVKGLVDLNNYELPPTPNAEMFDVRYGSNRYAEDLSSGNQSIEMQGMEYPIKVRVENMGIRLKDASGSGLNERLKAGEEVTISNSAISKLMVSGDAIPTTYSLEQNYPNPFNPSTKIEFSIPEDVNNVTLTIYNALGQRVAELVNSKLEAGYYSYVWNASDVATGLYIYELRTDKFVSVKKMMLLK